MWINARDFRIEQRDAAVGLLVRKRMRCRMRRVGLSLAEEAQIDDPAHATASNGVDSAPRQVTQAIRPQERIPSDPTATDDG